MRPTFALLTVAAGVALPTGVAAASTVSVDPAGGPAVFLSGAPASDVTSRVADGFVTFKDSLQPLTAGANCTAGPPVACAATAQDIRFGYGNDRFRGFSRFQISVSGGGGRDAIRAAGEYNIVSGGNGNDSVWENGNSLGAVNGDAGDDRLYTFEAPARLHGGTGNDLLVAGAVNFGNQLAGDDGNDELVVPASAGGSGTATGGAGADVIVIDTQFGGYTIDGGSGSDTIDGGPGVDTVTGGSGGDVIDVSGDATADSVDCGSGFDIVYFDAGDTVASNCEIRRPGPAPALPQVTAARANADAFVTAMPAIPAF
jgi:Ca2+-binding RTX toxin-like protein